MSPTPAAWQVADRDKPGRPRAPTPRHSASTAPVKRYALGPSARPWVTERRRRRTIDNHRGQAPTPHGLSVRRLTRARCTDKQQRSSRPPVCVARRGVGASSGHKVHATAEGVAMEAQQNSRVLLVANRTAATPRLIEAVRARAQDGPCKFALLIPDVTDREAADWTLETALRLMKPAARGSVEGLVGGRDPFESVQDAVRLGNFDEIIIRASQTSVEVAPARSNPTSRGSWSPGDRDRPGRREASPEEERMQRVGAGLGGLGIQ